MLYHFISGPSQAVELGLFPTSTVSPQALKQSIGKTLSLPCEIAEVWLWVLTVALTPRRRAGKGKNTIIIQMVNDNMDQL